MPFLRSLPQKRWSGASAPEAGRTTGGFFHDLKAVPPAPAALDDAAAARLWVESEKLIARIGV